MKKLWLLAALWIAVSGCAKKSDDQVVAVVGDREIPLYEITEDFMQIGMPEFTSADEELKAKRDHLDTRIEGLLLVKAAYAYGLDSDLEVLDLVKTESDKFLLDELFRVEIIEKTALDESEVRRWYKYWFISVRARHILVETEAEADSLLEEIRNGADFADMARAVSKDLTSRRRGGDLGRTYRWGDLVDPFQQTVFDLELDELSEPVETEYGWHIIELLEKTERDQLPFEQVREGIEAKIKSIVQRERQLQHRQELVKQYPIEIDTKTVEFLKNKIVEFAQVDTVVIPDSLRWDVDADFLSELEREKPFARYLDDQVVTLGQYLEWVNPRPPEAKPPLDDLTKPADFVFESVLYELLLDQARKLGLQEAELYKKRLKDFVESMMAEKLDNSILRRGISVSEQEIKEYYDSHPDEFFTELRLGVSEIQVETKEEAEQLYRRLKAGESFTTLAEQNTIRRGYKRNGGYLGYLKAYRRKEIYAVAETLKVDGLSQPFAAEEAWSVIRLDERLEPTLQDFNTVKRDLFTNMREARIDSTRSAFLDSLRSVTPITVHDELLTETIDYAKYENRRVVTPGQTSDSLPPEGPG